MNDFSGVLPCIAMMWIPGDPMLFAIVYCVPLLWAISIGWTSVNHRENTMRYVLAGLGGMASHLGTLLFFDRTRIGSGDPTGYLSGLGTVFMMIPAANIIFLIVAFLLLSLISPKRNNISE